MSSRTGLFAEQERRYLYYAILEVHQDSSRLPDSFWFQSKLRSFNW